MGSVKVLGCHLSLFFSLLIIWLSFEKGLLMLLYLTSTSYVPINVPSKAAFIRYSLILTPFFLILQNL